MDGVGKMRSHKAAKNSKALNRASRKREIKMNEKKMSKKGEMKEMRN